MPTIFADREARKNRSSLVRPYRDQESSAEPTNDPGAPVLDSLAYIRALQDEARAQTQVRDEAAAAMPVETATPDPAVATQGPIADAQPMGAVPMPGAPPGIARNPTAVPMPGAPPGIARNPTAVPMPNYPVRRPTQVQPMPQQGQTDQGGVPPQLLREIRTPTMLGPQEWARHAAPQLAGKKHISRVELNALNDQYARYVAQQTKLHHLSLETAKQALEERRQNYAESPTNPRNIPSTLEGQQGYAILTGMPDTVIERLQYFADKAKPGKKAADIPPKLLKKATDAIEAGNYDDPAVVMYLEMAGIRKPAAKSKAPSLLEELKSASVAEFIGTGKAGPIMKSYIDVTRAMAPEKSTKETGPSFGLATEIMGEQGVPNQTRDMFAGSYKDPKKGKPVGKVKGWWLGYQEITRGLPLRKGADQQAIQQFALQQMPSRQEVEAAVTSGEISPAEAKQLAGVLTGLVNSPTEQTAP